MKVTRVHFLSMNEVPRVYMDKTNGRLADSFPISKGMAKCLAVDIQNQVADGRGGVDPTPWGWCWSLFYPGGRLSVPPKRSEILQDIIVATDTVPLYHLSLLERR